jgi:hypothetical protein
MSEGLIADLIRCLMELTQSVGFGFESKIDIEIGIGVEDAVGQRKEEIMCVL